MTVYDLMTAPVGLFAESLIEARAKGGNDAYADCLTDAVWVFVGSVGLWDDTEGSDARAEGA